MACLAPFADHQVYDIDHVVTTLVAEFGEVWDPAYLNDVIAQAQHDLAGQIVATAMPEVLDRLVRHRLAELAETARSPRY